MSFIPRAPGAFAGGRAPGVEVPVGPAEAAAHPALAVAAVTAVAVPAAAVTAAVPAARLGRRRVQRPLRAPQGMRRGAAAFKGNEV